MAATGTTAAAATGKLLVLLLLGLTAPAAALAGYIEVRTRRAPERRLLRSPGSAACVRVWDRDRGRGARFGAAAGCLLPTPPARLSFAQSLAPRSGCLHRRRGQMKGVGAAGPPQPPTRRRRRRILGDTAPRALPPPGPCAPQPCALRRRSKWGGLHRVPGARSGRGACASGSHLDGRRAAVVDQVDLAAGMRLQPWRVAEMPRERGKEAPPGQRGALRPPLPPSRLHKSGKLGSPAFLLPGDVEAIHQYIWKALGGTFKW